MNESPEPDDDLSIRRLLAESETEESPELLEGLRLLRSFRARPAPAPTGELAVMLTPAPAQPRRRLRRHRGLILSFALAGAMAAGTTGVAANNDLRFATESFCADVIEQVLPLEGSGEPEPPVGPLPVEPLPDEQLSAGAPSAGEETPAVADDAAAEPEAEFAAEPEGPGAYPVPGDVPGEDEAPADVEAPPPADVPLPVPHAEPEPVVPDRSAQERGRNGSHTITARPPHQDSAGQGGGRPGQRGDAGAGRPGPGAGQGNSRDGRDATPQQLVPAAGTPSREAPAGGGKQP